MYIIYMYQYRCQQVSIQGCIHKYWSRIPNKKNNPLYKRRDSERYLYTEIDLSERTFFIIGLRSQVWARHKRWTNTQRDLKKGYMLYKTQNLFFNTGTNKWSKPVVSFILNHLWIEEVYLDQLFERLRSRPLGKEPTSLEKVFLNTVVLSEMTLR